MSVGAPIVPFVPQPKKEWVRDQEKKARIEVEDEESEEDEDYGNLSDEDELESVSSYSSASSDDSMQQHIKRLLPGEVGDDGEKNDKKADVSLIVGDLREIKRKRDWLYYVTWVWTKFQDARKRERLRRKHHILREFEHRIAQYYENQQKKIKENLVKHERAVHLERYQSEMRLRKNSKKKVDKLASVHAFTQDLIRRDHEKVQMDYRVRFLSRWAVEGADREEQEKIDMEKAQLLADLKRREQDLLDHRTKTIAEDAAILEEDKQISQGIQAMMVKYGMTSFGRKPDDLPDDRLEYLLDTGNALQMKKRQVDADKAAAAKEAALLQVPEAEDEMTRYMLLTIRNGVDIDKVLKSHKRSKYGKKKDKEHITPFAQDLSSTGDITTLKGSAIGEAGALSLASEFSRGMCPMLEHLNLRGCSIRTEGAGRLFVGIKMANLVSLRVLNLRGNFLGPFALAYFKTACHSGVMMNLQILVLSDNELGDEGITNLLEIVMEGHFLNIFEIHMERNSITDYGFNKLVTKLKSVQEVKCPNLQRMNVSNNPITPEIKRKHSPLPFYMSV